MLPKKLDDLIFKNPLKRKDRGRLDERINLIMQTKKKNLLHVLKIVAILQRCHIKK